MAQVMGITPPADGSAPIRENLARFGLFLDQAMRMGLSPEQTEQVAREVKSSPDRSLSPETRETLIELRHDRAWSAARGRRTRSHAAGVICAEAAGRDRRLRHDCTSLHRRSELNHKLRSNRTFIWKPSSDPDADNHTSETRWQRGEWQRT